MRTIMHRAGAIKTVWPLAAPALIIVVVVLPLRQESPATQQVVLNALINLIIVIGLYMFVGLSGVSNFGHISFMAIGAYVCAWLTIPPIVKSVNLQLPDFIETLELSAIPATLISGGVAALFAVIVGVPLMRLVGVAAGIGTL